MERLTVSKSMATCSLAQKPVFDMLDPSLQRFPQKTTIRTASFSSYFKHQEPNRKADDSEISIFDAQKYFNEIENDNQTTQTGPAVTPPLIGLDPVPERCEELPSVARFSSASSSADGYGRNYRTRSFHATPTASSEASWNSRTGLLTNPPGAFAVSIQNSPPVHEKKRGSAKKWLLRRRCPCSGKKSVQVEDRKVSEPRSPLQINIKSNISQNLNMQQIHEFVDHKAVERKLTEPQWVERREIIQSSQRISSENNQFAKGLSHQCIVASSASPFCEGTNGFTFPILAGTSTPTKILPNELPSSTNNKPPVEDLRRDSLEVYRPPTTHSRRPSFSFPSSPKLRVAAIIDDDIASDASSDLFEIDSFSTQTTSYPTPMCINNSNRRDSLEDASAFNARRLAGGGNMYKRSLDEPMTPSISPTECYAPSEVSIDWSVTTAEGFDRASVTNFSVITEDDHDHMAISRLVVDGGADCGKRRSGGYGGLLSCRCEKAVSVGPHPVKCGTIEAQKVLNSTLKHVSSRPQPSIVYNPQLASSHSAKLATYI